MRSFNRPANQRRFAYITLFAFLLTFFVHPQFLQLPAQAAVKQQTLPATMPMFTVGALTTLDTASTENFDTLPSAAGSTTWTNNSTLTNWYHARTGTGTTIVVENGNSNSGNLYSYGCGPGISAGTNAQCDANPSPTTDRALGSLGSGNAAVGNLYWGVRLQNNTGATITSLDVSYVGEQWRNSAAAAQTVAFSYLVGSPTVTGSLAEFQSAGTAVTSLDFTSPITGGAAGATNGNLAANRTAKSATITGLNIPNGSEVMLRWADLDHMGADHGLAIDDFSVTPHGAGDTAPSVSSTTPTNNATNVAVNSDITINFSESVNTAAGAFTISCATSGSHTFTQSSSPASSFTLNPDTDFANNESCTVTVEADNVTDQDAVDPPNNMAADYVFSFTTVSATPTLNINDVTLAEGDAGTTTFTFSVTLTSAAGPGGVTFDIATADGTAQDDNPATEDNDYVAKSLTGQSISQGSTGPYQFSVTVNGDTTAEPNETFLVNVTNITGANAGDTQGQGTITNDDVAVTATSVVISQIYGGGGNSNATYAHDYVELYNPTNATVDLTGWSLQYASSTGSGWDTTKQTIGGPIAPGEYFLVRLGTNDSNVGTPVPPANIAGDSINMSGTTGKIALVKNSEGLTSATPTCPLDDPDLVDFVGYGTGANCREGGATTASNAPAPSNTTAIFRKNGGITDTNNNANDFQTGAPNPRRTAPIVELGPWVAGTDPFTNGSNTPRDASVIVNFSEPVNVDPSWFNINCAVTGLHNDATIAVINTNKTFVIIPNTNFQAAETCTVSIDKDFIHDQDTDDANPNTDTLFADYSWNFTVSTGTAPPYPSSVHLTFGNPSNAVNNVNTPNNYLMEKPEFALSYNRDRGTPNWVSWHLSDEWIGTLQRVDTFRPDPAVPSDWYRVLGSDFSNSGFDRGHMVPNADRDKETSIPINQATFLMSNMLPQAPDNNQGPWADFENYLRTLLPANELYIVAGGVGTGGTGSNGFATTIANGHVTVPAATWKVVLVIPKASGDDVARVTPTTRTIAINMPNINGIRNNNWEDYLTTVDAVEALTGYDFFSNIPDGIENIIEAGTNGVNPPAADLVISKSDSPDPVITGSNLTYTITVGNSGPDAATNASWSDTLPSGTTFVSLSFPAGWNCTTPTVGAGGTVTCSNPSFANGGSSIFTLVVNVPSDTANGTVLTNTATVGAATADPNGDNNSATSTTTVAIPEAALALSLVVSPDPVQSGGTSTYLMTLTNSGNVTAQNVVLYQSDYFHQRGGTRLQIQSITAPAGFTCQMGGGLLDPPLTEVSCRGTLGAGQTVQFTVIKRQRTPLPRGLVIFHEAEVMTSTFEANKANNKATDTTQVN